MPRRTGIAPSGFFDRTGFLDRTGLLLAVCAGLCLFAAGPAFAQGAPDFDNPGPIQELGGGGQAAVAKLPSQERKTPAGLPGAQSNAAVAPADKSAQDMDPTTALFDAINRGDLAAARDAVDRGADLNGHNILGMTPIDLSIDLSRNAITFMLLSNNAGSAGSGGPPPAAKPVRTVASRQPASRAAPAKPAPAAARSSVVHPGPMPTYAEVGGGTPAPSAGFLGFGRN